MQTPQSRPGPAPVGWIRQTNCSPGETEPTRKIEIIIEIPLSALLGPSLFVTTVWIPSWTHSFIYFNTDIYQHCSSLATEFEKYFIN